MKKQIERIGNYLNKAKKVLVCGKGSSGLAAKEMEIRFMRIGADVDSITDTDLMRMRAVFQDEDSLVFGFSIGGQKERNYFSFKRSEKSEELKQSYLLRTTEMIIKSFVRKLY